MPSRYPPDVEVDMSDVTVSDPSITSGSRSDAQPAASSDASAGGSGTAIDTSNSQLLAAFAQEVSGLVMGHTAYNSLHSQTGSQVNLSGTGTPELVADCSGWVGYAMESVAPLQGAVLQAQRANPPLNRKVHPYKAKSFNPDENDRAWAQADALQRFFGDHDGAGFEARRGTGFTSVEAGIAGVQAGDVIAYALGIYSDPQNKDSAQDPSLDKPQDTGHVMIADGRSQEVWSRDDGGTLDTDAPSDLGVTAADVRHGLASNVEQVWAVKVTDSSTLLHFADSNDVDGKRNGLGDGTILFATDKSGTVVQTRFAKGDPWKPEASSDTPGAPLQGHAVALAVGRLSGAIDLSKVPLTNGQFVVNVNRDAAPVLNGTDYHAKETLTGQGEMLVEGGGTLRLDHDNNFTGGTEVTGQGTTVSVDASRGLGQTSAAVTLDAGTTLDLTAKMTFRHEITLNGAATIDVATDQTVRFDGNIAAGPNQPSAALDISGHGTLALNGQQGTIGATIVEGGATLTIASDVAHGQLTLNDGAKLRISRNTVIDSLDVAGAATIQVAKGTTLTVDGPLLGASGTESAAVLHVTGGGTLVIDGHGASSAPADATNVTIESRGTGPLSPQDIQSALAKGSLTVSGQAAPGAGASSVNLCGLMGGQAPATVAGTLLAAARALPASPCRVTPGLSARHAPDVLALMQPHGAPAATLDMLSAPTRQDVAHLVHLAAPHA